MQPHHPEPLLYHGHETALLRQNGWHTEVENRKIVRGFVYDGKVNSPVIGIEIKTQFEDDEKTQKFMRFELTDSKDRRFTIDAEALTVIPVLKVSPGFTTLLNEAFSKFKYNSQIGYGITEYLWTEKCL